MFVVGVLETGNGNDDVCFDGVVDASFGKMSLELHRDWILLSDDGRKVFRYLMKTTLVTRKEKRRL